MSIEHKLEVSPWADKHEFLSVYEGLYGTNRNNKAWAINKIDVWKDRCYPLEPEIEVSTLLVKTLTIDINNGEPEVLVPLYSLVLMRFGCFLRKQSETMTLNEIGKMRGVPEFVINTRNKVAHGIVPPLEVLRSASMWIHESMRLEYWNLKAHTMRDYKPDPKTHTSNYTTLVCQYYAKQMETVITPSKQKNRKILPRLWNEIKLALKSNGDSFTVDLLNSGVFLMNPDTLTALLKPNETGFLDPDKQEVSTNGTMVLPKILEKIWADIIILLHRWGQIHNFLEKLLLELECKDAFKQKLIASWVYHIIACILSRISVKESILAKYFSEHYQGLDKIKLVRCATVYRNDKSQCIVDLLLENATNFHAVEKLSTVLQLQGKDVQLNCPDPSELSLYTSLETQQERFAQEAMERGLAETEVKKNWHKAINIDVLKWRDIPIGAILADDKDATDGENMEITVSDEEVEISIESQEILVQSTTENIIHNEDDYMHPLENAPLNLNRSYLSFD